MAIFLSTEGGNSSSYGEFQTTVINEPDSAYFYVYYDQPRFANDLEGDCFGSVYLINFDTGQSYPLARFGDGATEGLAHKRYTSSSPNWVRPYRVRFSVWIRRNRPGIPECSVSITFDKVFVAYGMVVTLAEPPAPSEIGSRLGNPYPNPSTGTTRIDFSLDRAQQVRVAVYDQLTREVEVIQDGLMPAGSTSLSLSTTSFRAGVYVVRATGEGWSETRRFTHWE